MPGHEIVYKISLIKACGKQCATVLLQLVFISVSRNNAVYLAIKSFPISFLPVLLSSVVVGYMWLGEMEIPALNHYIHTAMKQGEKVRHFGISNHRPMQTELLKRYVTQPLIANQLQFSIPVSSLVAGGMEVNCRLHGLTTQACAVDLTREEWCRLYLTADHPLP